MYSQQAEKRSNKEVISNHQFNELKMARRARSCARVDQPPIFRMVIPPLIGNPYSEHINPLPWGRWPSLPQENNGSLDLTRRHLGHPDSFHGFSSCHLPQTFGGPTHGLCQMLVASHKLEYLLVCQMIVAPYLKLFRLFVAGFKKPILKYQLKVCFD